MRLSSISALLALALVACGDDETPDDTAAVDDSDSEADSDASGDASDSTADSEDEPEVGLVRFAFGILAEPTGRTDFTATVDGAPIAAGLDAGVLAAEYAYFYPGRTEGWVEMAPGTHTLALSGTITHTQCLNPSCEQTELRSFPTSSELDFEVTAGGHTTVVAVLRYLSDRNNVFGAQFYPAALDHAPVAGQAAVQFVRGPDTIWDTNDLRVASYQPGVSEGQGASITLAPGAAGVLAVPAQPAALNIYREPTFSAPYYAYYDLPTIAPGELLLVWDGGGLTVAGAATGAGTSLVQRSDSGNGGGGGGGGGPS